MERSPPATHHSPPWYRHLLDIVLLVATSETINYALDHFPWPADGRLEIALTLVAKLPVCFVAWLLVRLRGETVADLGLRRPRNWGRTLLSGAAVAATIFTIVAVLEHAGWRRNLSAFKALQGNLVLTLFHVFNGLVGAGFYEEFMFRGFLFYGLAMAFRGGRAGWITAAVIQSVVFGAAHGYQGPLGMLITGMIGLTMAGLYVATGRNLWAPIIAHGLYDAARAIIFYFQGPPTAS